MIVPDGHELANGAAVKFSEILSYPQISLNDESTLQRFLEERTEELDRKPNLRVKLSSFDAICEMVNVGVGISIIPESTAIRHRRSMDYQIVQLDEEWAIRERKLIARDIDSLPKCAKDIVELISLPASA
ncbi:LysR substrate binding domain protein [compost metagenome]